MPPPRRSPMKLPTPSGADGGGDSNVAYAFPLATDEDYALRNRIRRKLHEKAVTLGLAEAAREKADRWRVKVSDGKLAKAVAQAKGPSEGDPPDYAGPLNKIARDGLALAFSRYVTPDPFADMPTPIGQRPLTHSRLKERSKDTISVLEFEAALRGMGVQEVPQYHIAALIGDCGLDRDGRVHYPTFLRFLALPYPEPEMLLSGPHGPFPATAPAARRAPFEGKSPPRRTAYVSQHPPPPPPGRQNGVWAYAPGSLDRVKPKIHVAWPVDLTQPDSPFWTAVNALEAAVLREVQKRAAVQAATPDAGLGPTPRSGSRFNLRRAFLFFDRRNRKGLSVQDLHFTCAELGLLDPPRRPHLPASALPGADAAVSNTVDFTPTQPLNPVTAAEAAALRSPRRLLPPSPGRSGTGSGSSISNTLVPPMGASAAAQQAAADAAEADAYLYSDPTERGDPVDAEMAAASRALAVALFRRMHGESDPGNSGAPIGVRTSARNPEEGAAFQRTAEALVSESQPVCASPLTYNLFARWAAPLGTFLRELREKVQADFLAAATIGGGAKDFDRAFLRIDANGDGVMSVSEFRSALGPIARVLTPQQEEELISYFDVDGSGKIDFREFLGIMRGSAAANAAAAAEVEA